MFDINGTFLIVFVSFLGFVVLMKALFFDPLMATIDSRENLIQTASDTAKQASLRQLEVSQSITQKLQVAYGQAQGLVQQKTDVARAEASQLKTTAKETASTELSNAVNQLNSQAEQSYQNLQGGQKELAQTIIKKLSNAQLAKV